MLCFSFMYVFCNNIIRSSIANQISREFVTTECYQLAYLNEFVRCESYKNMRLLEKSNSETIHSHGASTLLIDFEWVTSCVELNCGPVSVASLLNISQLSNRQQRRQPVRSPYANNLMQENNLIGCWSHSVKC